jgi:hypothetical protein
MHPRVGAGDPVRLGLLRLAQIGLVLPQRPPGVLERLGRLGAPALAAAGGVPRLAAHLVESLGGPRHDMERIRCPHRVRAPIVDHLGDPLRAVGRDVCDLRAALGSEQVEEPAQRGLVPPRTRPHQLPGVVIHHHRQIPMTTLIRSLIGSYPAQIRQPVDRLGRVAGLGADDSAAGADRNVDSLLERAVTAAEVSRRTGSVFALTAR